MRRISKAVCVLIFFTGIVVPLLLFVSVNFEIEGTRSGLVVRAHERKPLDYVDAREAEELRFQIHELEEIKASVRNELRSIEQHRTKVIQEVEAHRDTLFRVRRELSLAKTDLQDAKSKLAKAARENRIPLDTPEHKVTTPPPIIILPQQQRLPSLQDALENQPSEGQYSKCTYPLCFDFSKCPLMQPFRVYLSNQHHGDLFELKYSRVVSDFVSSLEQKHSLTDDPDLACVFVVLIGPVRDFNIPPTADQIGEKLRLLPHWTSDGANHVLVDLSDGKLTSTLLNHVSTGRAVVVQSHLSLGRYHRSDYDILSPPLTTMSNDSAWKGLPFHLPAKRSLLLYFQGRYMTADQDSDTEGIGVGRKDLEMLKSALSGRERTCIEIECESVSEGAMDGEWALCGTELSRFEKCSQSTFALILGGSRGKQGSATYTRLIESLRCGAIPVVFGISVLPFDTVIEWSKAAVILPPGVFSSVHYIIRNLDHKTILEYRRQGQFLWKSYFSSPKQILDSIIAIIRYESRHPPPPSPEFTGTQLVTVPGNVKRIPSPTFQYNFSIYTQEFWNHPPGPFYMYSLTPFKPGPVSGSQYVNLDENDIFQLPPHIVQAGGITGPFFEGYLLGNDPEEQFTVVMLTYQRNDVLVQAVDRLRGLSFLNKVVVVWNNEEDPTPNMQWPSIGVPIEVVRAERNSLNNRFLPFSNIETEAVLSIDDDVHLRQDEIQFGFRVWREAKERVVGFPGRFHAWDVRHRQWLYNSNYTCELSMVLTGAAFFHKYYSYLYTHWMPGEIREMVDKFMNCEDIAMNFLVSHITRKPPLKVTSRWTFRCPGCPDTLSTSDEHFNERHVCINFLTKVYGYMPLLYTQFRVDSILFKTRLPSHLEKCYQFI